MNLGTHVFFAGAVVAIFTGNPYFTLLAGIGSFIPDLDREYLFVGQRKYIEEQWHRSLFHNLLFISALFFVNEWLAVGAFLHSFLDSFTTEKDKGVEWLFPFSRLVKRGKYALTAKTKDGRCNIALVDQNPPDRVCFLNEDSIEMTRLSAKDLRESKPVPWRRTYGPAANNQIFDRWLAVGSFSLLVIYSLVNYGFGLAGRELLFSRSLIAPMSLLTSFVLIYLGGWLKKNSRPRKQYLVLFALAGFFMPLSAVLVIDQISSYIFPLDPIFVLAACAVLAIEAVLVWQISIYGKRKALV